MNLLLHGSLTLVFLWLVFGGLGVPVPEDLALLATGVLVHRGVVPPMLALAVVFVGVLAGDALLFLFARHLGPRAFEHRLFRRLLPPERRQRMAAAYERHGGRLVFLARHVAGLRGAVFALAGASRMPVARFLFWDTLAACVSVPLTVALGYYGSLHIDRVRAGIAHAEHWVLLASAVGALAYVAWNHRHALLQGARPIPRS